MDLSDLVSQQTIAGWLLILSFIVFIPAGMLYTARAIWKRPAAQSQSFLYWERGLVMAAVLVAALGLVQLDKLLEPAGDRVLAPSGLLLFLIGATLVLAAETFALSQGKWAYAPVIAFVVLSFLGQAAFGASILGTGFLPGWVGWATLGWCLAWLVILPIARPKDIYYPWLHYIAPLIIGISLLARG